MTTQSATKRQTQAYLRTKVMTANSAELRLMLFDGAIKFADQAKSGLERADYEVVYVGITRTQDILMELINGLQPDKDPELCKRLSGLYTFMYTRMMQASMERDPAILEEVLELLRFERETWAMLVERLSNPSSDDDTPRQALSVEG